MRLIVVKVVQKPPIVKDPPVEKVTRYLGDIVHPPVIHIEDRGDGARCDLPPQNHPPGVTLGNKTTFNCCIGSIIIQCHYVVCLYFFLFKYNSQLKNHHLKVRQLCVHRVEKFRWRGLIYLKELVPNVK